MKEKTRSLKRRNTIVCELKYTHKYVDLMCFVTHRIRASAFHCWGAQIHKNAVDFEYSLHTRQQRFSKVNAVTNEHWFLAYTHNDRYTYVYIHFNSSSPTQLSDGNLNEQFTFGGLSLSLHAAWIHVWYDIVRVFVFNIFIAHTWSGSRRHTPATWYFAAQRTMTKIESKTTTICTFEMNVCEFLRFMENRWETTICEMELLHGNEQQRTTIATTKLKQNKTNSVYTTHI